MPLPAGCTILATSQISCAANSSADSWFPACVRTHAPGEMLMTLQHNLQSLRHIGMLNLSSTQDHLLISGRMFRLSTLAGICRLVFHNMYAVSIKTFRLSTFTFCYISGFYQHRLLGYFGRRAGNGREGGTSAVEMLIWTYADINIKHHKLI